MKLKILAIILFAITALAASAKVNVEDSLSYENITFAGLNLNYRLAEKGDSANIVVIYLHGGSGHGNDNITQMKSPAIAEIYNYLNDNISQQKFIPMSVATTAEGISARTNFFFEKLTKQGAQAKLDVENSWG